jgi:hypothetical protein
MAIRPWTSAGRGPAARIPAPDFRIAKAWICDMKIEWCGANISFSPKENLFHDMEINMQLIDL